MTKSNAPDVDVGFWSSFRDLGRLRFAEVVWPEVVLSLVVGLGGSLAVISNASASTRLGFAIDLLGISATLLGVTFAALAIVVSLPSTSYLRHLEEAPEQGMRSFLQPFLIALGSQVALLLLAASYRFSDGLPSVLQDALFCLIAFLFVYVALDLVNLGRQLVKHGILRAFNATIDE